MGGPSGDFVYFPPLFIHWKKMKVVKNFLYDNNGEGCVFFLGNVGFLGSMMMMKKEEVKMNGWELKSFWIFY